MHIFRMLFLHHMTKENITRAKRNEIGMDGA